MYMFKKVVIFEANNVYSQKYAKYIVIICVHIFIIDFLRLFSTCILIQYSRTFNT